MEQYERRAGVLSQQLNSARGIKKRTIAIYIFVNFARRIALAYVIASTDLNYLGQLLVCMFINQFYLTFVMYNMLFLSPRDRFVETSNEIFIILTMYHLFMFTDAIDAELRGNVCGNSVVALTFLNIAVNLAPVVFDLFVIIKDRIKRRYQIYKQKKLREEQIQRGKEAAIMGRRFEKEKASLNRML